MKLQAMSTSPLYTRTRYFCRKNQTFNKDTPGTATNHGYINTTANQWLDMFFKVYFKKKELIFQ